MVFRPLIVSVGSRAHARLLGTMCTYYLYVQRLSRARSNFVEVYVHLSRLVTIEEFENSAELCHARGRVRVQPEHDMRHSVVRVLAQRLRVFLRGPRRR